MTVLRYGATGAEQPGMLEAQGVLRSVARSVVIGRKARSVDEADALGGVSGYKAAR